MHRDPKRQELWTHLRPPLVKDPKNVKKSVGCTVSVRKKYKKQILNTFKNNKIEIFSIKLDPEHKLKPKLGFSIDFDGNWFPKPLEDMYPFLDGKKLEKIMKI